MRERRQKTIIPELNDANAPRVALVGRTNVGKSSLFNRLTETSLAIVGAEEHLTRDRQYAPVAWGGRSFQLVDTGGYDVGKTDLFSKEIKNQVELAVKESDLILFVVEKGDSLLPADRQMAGWLRQMEAKVLVVVNKADHKRDRVEGEDVRKLGFPAVTFVSAKSGGGTGDLLDAIIHELPPVGHTKGTAATREGGKRLNIAFIGKPNAGKSSLVNAVLGEERVIVSPIAHTTRSIHIVPFTYADTAFNLIDTAGLRKQSKTRSSANARGASQAERLSTEQTKDVINHADVIVVVLDITADVGSQDSRLARLVVDAGKSLIIVANKWDLVPERNAMTPFMIEQRIRNLYPYLAWAPVVITSATTGKNVRDILDAAVLASAERHKELPKTAMNRFLKFIIEKHKPSRGKGTGHPRLLNFEQVAYDPPTFEVLTEYLNLHPAYLRFMEKQLREKFGFVGTPIRIQMRPLKN